MIRVLPSLETVEREIRRRVCAHCHWRPAHSECFGPEAVRPCEERCGIFIHLPMLRKAAILHDPMLSPPREALAHRVAELCEADERREAKAGGGQGDCPLKRYGGEVVEAILDLVGRD